jgi:hypothetical protein
MNDDNLIAEGIRAFARLQRNNKRGFESWLAVAEGIEAGKHKLMQRLQLNSLGNSQIGKKAYALWLRESGYIQVPIEARKALDRIREPENLSRIRSWYNTLSDKQKFRWNQPTTIWRNWQATIGETVRARPILVAMSLDAKGKVIRRISEETYNADLTEYIELTAQLVGFLADKFDQNSAGILELVKQRLNDRQDSREGEPSTTDAAFSLHTGRTHPLGVSAGATNGSSG